MEWVILGISLGISLYSAWLVYFMQKDMKALDVNFHKIEMKNQELSRLVNFLEHSFPHLKRPNANRCARTDEQRAQASAKRKEWWARKKALEVEAAQPWPSSERAN